MWTPPEPRTLEQMHRRETRYEILIEIDGVAKRAGFAHRITQDSLLSFARAYKDWILPHLPPEDKPHYSRQRGELRLAHNVRVYKSGRTERDCRTLDQHRQAKQREITV